MQLVPPIMLRAVPLRTRRISKEAQRIIDPGSSRVLKASLTVPNYTKRRQKSFPVMFDGLSRDVLYTYLILGSETDPNRCRYSCFYRLSRFNEASVLSHSLYLINVIDLLLANLS